MNLFLEFFIGFLCYSDFRRASDDSIINLQDFMHDSSILHITTIVTVLNVLDLKLTKPVNACDFRISTNMFQEPFKRPGKNKFLVNLIES